MPVCSRVFAATILASLISCGGVGEGAVAPQPAVPAPPPPAIAGDSYANYKAIGLSPQSLPGGDNTVRAYGNFAGSGRLDLFRAVLTYNASLPASQATPSRFEFFARQADGAFILNTSVMPQSNGCLHPRKAIVADFNGDGRPDIFVACHGYDAAPFPGETNKVVLSQPNGTYVVSDASADVGFHHGAAAADLNGDGKVDVVVVNNFDPDRAYVLLNDGVGKFTRERVPRLPSAIRGAGFFSVELVDVNEDGKLDLVLGGHEFEGAATSVFINPGANNFLAVSPSVVPSVPNEGVVLDFTLTGTGSSRALWVLRTSGGDGTFYQSRVIQRVTWPGLTSTVALNRRPAQWIPWLVPALANGVPIVASDNLSDATSVPQ